MPRYPDERREAAVAKLLPPYNLSPREVAEQEGVSIATVYKWRKACDIRPQVISP
ncbi:helix-turn-helix domain-containing protein [Ectothiorhodospira sp. BSL-9]|uniref:helix-turn-helix domain-containing protein n=1 Tax=Ectothiorhodospira sp. BSL-9 TaxID=1442136 RepID=UPI0012E7CAD1|nr:helix-turn-helix domain-containing protein [Ectothiorhodospira sp. BSL-9]